jgi:chloramphenicol 3-O-phosphotransferase
MAIAVAATRQVLADAYKTLSGAANIFVGVATGDPGTSATPANEATGGAPAYARKQSTWTSSSGGVINGSAVTIDVATGTYTYILLATLVSGNNMVDKALVTSVAMSAQGQIVVTPTYTQT